MAMLILEQLTARSQQNLLSSRRDQVIINWENDNNNIGDNEASSNNSQQSLRLLLGADLFLHILFFDRENLEYLHKRDLNKLITEINDFLLATRPDNPTKEDGKNLKQELEKIAVSIDTKAFIKLVE